MKLAMRKDHRGFSLLEVLIAVVVLSFGMLALAALNASILRAGAETKARSAAVALGQQVLEDARAFSFVRAPTGYEGPTYEKLSTWENPKSVSMRGVTYSVNQSVTRFAADGSEDKGAFNPAAPGYKSVTVEVSWKGSDGDKSVVLKDSIAALAPADALNVISMLGQLSEGPQVWIEPPNKDNPAVVPIAVGGDQSAASSNPIPRRFTKQDSNTAATVFSVHTFTGDKDGAEVLLNRKLDVAAVTCQCSKEGKQSSAVNPTYEPVIWNGRQLAYMDPRPLPTGTAIGSYATGQATKDIDEMCTVCCRDHNESASRSQRPDPYRLLTEGYGNEHYRGSGTDGLWKIEELTTNKPEYSEACHLIRVNGRSRLAIDPMQNMMVAVS